MSRLYSSREVVNVLRRAGFVEVSRRGSHVKLRRSSKGETRTVIVKDPAEEVPAGTFASVLRQSGLSKGEFRRLLGRRRA